MDPYPLVQLCVSANATACDSLLRSTLGSLGAALAFNVKSTLLVIVLLVKSTCLEDATSPKLNPRALPYVQLDASYQCLGLRSHDVQIAPLM